MIPYIVNQHGFRFQKPALYFVQFDPYLVAIIEQTPDDAISIATSVFIETRNPAPDLPLPAA